MHFTWSPSQKNKSLKKNLHFLLPQLIQLLLRHGADPTLRNYEAQTALEVATGGTKTLLLDSVTRATESSHRLLLQAAWQGNIEVICRLLVSCFVFDNS